MEDVFQYPIGSMVMVYLPTSTIKINQMYIGIYTIHGSYGYYWKRIIFSATSLAVRWLAVTSSLMVDAWPSHAQRKTPSWYTYYILSYYIYKYYINRVTLWKALKNTCKLSSYTGTWGAQYCESVQENHMHRPAMHRDRPPQRCRWWPHPLADRLHAAPPPPPPPSHKQ